MPGKRFVEFRSLGCRDKKRSGKGPGLAGNLAGATCSFVLEGKTGESSMAVVDHRYVEDSLAEGVQQYTLDLDSCAALEVHA